MSFDYDGFVRRCDFDLRSEYPEIKTRLFKFAQFSYVIYCTGVDDRFDEISRVFDYSIRPVSTPVALTNHVPKTYLYEIDPISDFDIPSNFEGISYRAIDLLNLLASTFPDINIRTVIGNEGDNKIKIHVSGTITTEQSGRLLSFLTNLKQSIPQCMYL